MSDLNAFAIYQYQVHLTEARGLHEKTVDAILRHIWQFVALCNQADFRDVNVDMITLYKSRFQAVGPDGDSLSASTIVHAFANLRAFFEWLPRQPGYDVVPADLYEYFTPPKRLVQIANAPTEKSYPSHEEVVLVVEAMPVNTFIDRRNRTIIALTYLTAIRVGALITLTLKHVDPERRLVKQYARDHVATKNSKTMLTAWLPVGENFDQIVIDWIAEMTSLGAGPDTPLFPRAARHSFGSEQQQDWEFLASKDAVSRIMTTAAAQVGVDRFTPHRLRDTIASMIDRWAVTFEERKALSQNLGHEDLRTTFERYAPVSETRQHELIATMRQRGAGAFDYDVMQALANAPEYVKKAVKDLLLRGR